MDPLCFGPSIHCKQNRVFVLINYSGDPSLDLFHGKAIAIDIDDLHAPFPSICIIHEMRVRGFHPFRHTNPKVPKEILWQDWITSQGMLADENDRKLFKRDPGDGDIDFSDDSEDNSDHNENNGDDDSGNGNSNHKTSGGDDNNDNGGNNDIPRRVRNMQRGKIAGTSLHTRRLELNPGVIADILAATHAMPSWKACQIENTSWRGTAEENMERYISSVGYQQLCHYTA